MLDLLGFFCNGEAFCFQHNSLNIKKDSYAVFLKLMLVNEKYSNPWLWRTEVSTYLLHSHCSHSSKPDDMSNRYGLIWTCPPRAFRESVCRGRMLAALRERQSARSTARGPWAHRSALPRQWMVGPGSEHQEPSLGCRRFHRCQGEGAASVRHAWDWQNKR